MKTILLTLFAVLLLASCGQSSSELSQDNYEPARQERTTSVWIQEMYNMGIERAYVVLGDPTFESQRQLNARENAIITLEPDMRDALFIEGKEGFRSEAYQTSLHSLEYTKTIDAGESRDFKFIYSFDRVNEVVRLAQAGFLSELVIKVNEGNLNDARNFFELLTRLGSLDSASSETMPKLRLELGFAPESATDRIASRMVMGSGSEGISELLPSKGKAIANMEKDAKFKFEGQIIDAQALTGDTKALEGIEDFREYAKRADAALEKSIYETPAVEYERLIREYVAGIEHGSVRTEIAKAFGSGYINTELPREFISEFIRADISVDLAEVLNRTTINNESTIKISERSHRNETFYESIETQKVIEALEPLRERVREIRIRNNAIRRTWLEGMRTELERRSR